MTGAAGGVVVGSVAAGRAFVAGLALPGWTVGIETAELLRFWIAVFSHLWQTTLFVFGVAFISVLLRDAPARSRHQLWSLALLKILLPVSMFGWLLEAWNLPTKKATAVLSDLGNLPWFLPTFRVMDPATPMSGTVAFAIWLGTLAWLGTAIWFVDRTCRRSSRIATKVDGSLSPDHAARISELRNRLGLSSREVVVTGAPILPCVVGVFRPRVVFPAGMLDDNSLDALVAIGLHERAHLRRREPLRLAIQRLALALFFYFPPLWFVLVRLHWTAELACDEEAVVAGADSRELSRAIAHALRSGLSAPSPAAALGSARRSLLTERLNQLQSHRRYRSMRRHHGTVLFAALALAALLFAPKVERVSAADGVSPPPTASGRHAKSAAPTLEAEGAAGPSAAREREYSDFDVAPTPIADTMVMPTYPEEYRNVEATGRVLLRVRVSQEGVVSHIEELSGVDGYPEFTKAAEAAVSQWEFEPATLEGKPVTVDILIPIQFALD